jgi:hypothetical protein
MQKIDLGQTINTMANIGVIAGIAFLAYEVRQNTLAAKAQATESHLAAAMDSNSLIASNPQLADLIAKTIAGGEVTPGEDIQLSNLFANRLRAWQNTYLQYENGVLPEELLSGFDETNLSLLEQSVRFRDYWETRKIRYTLAFRGHVDGLLASTNVQ